MSTHPIKANIGMVAEGRIYLHSDVTLEPRAVIPVTQLDWWMEWPEAAIVELFTLGGHSVRVTFSEEPGNAFEEFVGGLWAAVGTSTSDPA